MQFHDLIETSTEGPVLIEAVVDAAEPMMPPKMPPDYAENFRKALPKTPGHEQIEAGDRRGAAEDHDRGEARMTERWDIELSEPLTFRRDGEERTLRTMDDTRGLLSAHEPSERERELCQAAVTAVTKAADSGHPSDREMATEQMRVLLRFLAGSSPLRPFYPRRPTWRFPSSR